MRNQQARYADPKGVWRESVIVEKRANPDAPIVIRGVERDGSVIDGASELRMLAQAWGREPEALGDRRRPRSKEEFDWLNWLECKTFDCFYWFNWLDWF
jgi:hypothetical protein